MNFACSHDEEQYEILNIDFLIFRILIQGPFVI